MTGDMRLIDTNVLVHVSAVSKERRGEVLRRSYVKN